MYEGKRKDCEYFSIICLIHRPELAGHEQRSDRDVSGPGFISSSLGIFGRCQTYIPSFPLAHKDQSHEATGHLRYLLSPKVRPFVPGDSCFENRPRNQQEVDQNPLCHTSPVHCDTLITIEGPRYGASFDDFFQASYGVERSFPFHCGHGEL